ncbi:MAG: CAP domain-containing protein [Chitinophagaceae bacterium]
MNLNLYRKLLHAAVCLLVLLAPLLSGAQGWADAEWQAANTARDISGLTDAEKETILYLNLCRLYPQKFADLEVKNYTPPAEYGDYLDKSPYKKSLLKDLASRRPVQALVFDTALYQNATCFAAELGNSGRTGHARTTCPKGNYAECLSYGMHTGKDIALQWLIDHEVASLGHRKICLDPAYHKIAVSTHAHKQWKVCAVAEIIW